MSNHYKEVCTCGVVIAECRCAAPRKDTTIEQDGCLKCSRKKRGLDQRASPDANQAKKSASDGPDGPAA